MWYTQYKIPKKNEMFHFILGHPVVQTVCYSKSFHNGIAVLSDGWLINAWLVYGWAGVLGIRHCQTAETNSHRPRRQLHQHFARLQAEVPHHRQRKKYTSSSSLIIILLLLLEVTSLSLTAKTSYDALSCNIFRCWIYTHVWAYKLCYVGSNAECTLILYGFIIIIYFRLHKVAGISNGVVHSCLKNQ